MTINDKTNPQPSTETPPSTTNTAAPTPSQKINTENNINDILVSLYQKRDLGQLSQCDCKEITSRESTLRKYKANLKQKDAASKQQQKFRVNQKRKIQAIEEQTGAKLSKKLQEEEKNVYNVELIAAISRIAISGSAAHARDLS